MGDIISSKIKDPYGEDGESERFFCLEAEMDSDGLLTSLEGPRDGCASI